MSRIRPYLAIPALLLFVTTLVYVGGYVGARSSGRIQTTFWVEACACGYFSSDGTLKMSDSKRVDVLYPAAGSEWLYEVYAPLMKLEAGVRGSTYEVRIERPSGLTT